MTEFSPPQATPLRILQRGVSRRKLGGSNGRKAVAALQRQHERIANRRKDYLYKLAHGLVERYDRIALEDLQIVNMAQNHYLSKSILDAGRGYLKLHLAQGWSCSVLGESGSYVQDLLSVRRRLFLKLSLCQTVGCRVSVVCLSMDRDHNAARNILKRAGHARWGLTCPVGKSVPQEAVAL